MTQPLFVRQGAGRGFPVLMVAALIAGAIAIPAPLALRAQAVTPAVRAAAKPVRASASRSDIPAVVSLEQNGEPLDLAALGGIRVVRNGALLFVDTKPVTVRLRDAKGSIRQLARAGAGPGEFRAPPQFIAYRADSIVAYDAGLRRWSVLSPNGVFVRVLATGPESASLVTRAAWVAEGAIVHNAALEDVRAPLPEVIRQVVAGASVNDAPVVIRQVSNGDLWAAATFDARTWTVFDRAGRKRNTLSFPTSFRLQYANDTAAFGAILDSDDAPQIMMMPLRSNPGARDNRATLAPSATQNARAASGGEVTNDAAAADRKALTGVMRTMVGNEERVYSDSAHYTMSVAALKLDLASEVVVTIVSADARGWFGIAMNRRTRVTCAMGVGFGVIGWSEAVPYCSN